MKESEKEEASHWLEKLTALFEQTEVAVCDVARLNMESSAQQWDSAFSNANASALINAIGPINELPKPENKELRKLKDCYADLVATCLKSGHLYLNSYYNGKLGRFRYSQMIRWTTMTNLLLEKFLKQLEKIRQEIKG